MTMKQQMLTTLRDASLSPQDRLWLIDDMLDVVMVIYREQDVSLRSCVNFRQDVRLLARKAQQPPEN